ncbi:hypothetical protein EXM22_07120 [Oceanispirochaeta crateris]|uniref:Uncharacterized protein n=1 Tax=Oceanispirochaeta crateris TaxID=2518645 RepID=A0A5C1QKP0_9SPIO|nr:DUF5312 family protein [Oceanispirochaeta crateris]QEN07769.1 hypothetical protein EXM22_07120 [Oceanispirochaeta crateris]
MGKDNVFDSLVKDLSSEERRKMIEKLDENIHISREPLDLRVENEVVQTIEQEYKALFWLDKFIVFFKSLFLAKDKLEITKKIVIKRIARQVSQISPEFFDIKNHAITGEFCNLIIDLSNSVDFIRNPLTVCFEIDKNQFYSLMGQLEFPQIHQELSQNINPWEHSSRHPSQDIHSIRRNLTENLEACLSKISREDRLKMMEMTRTLNHMYQLSTYPFKQIVSQFPDSVDGTLMSASFSGLSSPLTELGSILKSFINPPSLKLLEAVFLLYYSLAGRNTGDSLEDLVSQGISRCDTLFEKIREFNKSVPFSDLLKVINEDPFFQISDRSGGEDWFYFFRQYWQDALNEQFRLFNREKVLEEAGNELLRYWDLNSLSFINGYGPTEKSAIFSYSMASLNTFFLHNYQKKLYYPMKIILVDGNFYKKSNRDEYDKMFQVLVKIGDRIKWFENSLLPDGDSGRKMRDVSHEFKDDKAESDRQIMKLKIGVNRDALMVLEDSLHCLFTMGKLMNGIVLGNGGSYDTLSNFSELGGRNNEELRQSVTEAADDIHKISHSLQDIINLEKEKMEEYIKEMNEQ